MKIVVILSRFPYPLEKGDKLRAYHQIRELSRKHEIFLIAVSDRIISSEEEQELEKYCSKIFIFPLKKSEIVINVIKALIGGKPLQTGFFYSGKIKREINHIIDDIKPHHIFCQLVRVADYVKHIKTIPMTLDYQDAFSKGI